MIGEEEGFSFIALDAADIQNLAINTNTSVVANSSPSSGNNAALINAPSGATILPNHNQIKTEAAVVQVSQIFVFNVMTNLVAK